MAYFSTSRPLSKAAFVALCTESSQLAQLFYAPLGLPQAATDLLTLEEHSTAFRQWEDAISTHLYKLRGVSPDRVAASMHTYLEVQKDPEVLQALREAQLALNSLLEGEAVVELPNIAASSHTSARLGKERSDDATENGDVVLAVSPDINTAETTALLLSQILSALALLAPISPCVLPPASDALASTATVAAAFASAYWSRKYGPDASVHAKLGLAIGKRSFQPTDLAHLRVDSGVPGGGRRAGKAVVVRAVEALSTALDVDIAVPSSSSSSSSSSSTSSGSSSTRVRFSVSQYLSLLQVHADSAAVSAVLLQHLPEHARSSYAASTATATGGDSDSDSDTDTDTDTGVSLLDAFRISMYGFDVEEGAGARAGGPWAGLALSASPMVSLVTQMEGALKVERRQQQKQKQQQDQNPKQKPKPGRDGNDDENDDDEEEEEGEQAQSELEQSYYAIRRSFTLQERARAALDKDDDEDDDRDEDEDDEDEDGEEGDALELINAALGGKTDEEEEEEEDYEDYDDEVDVAEKSFSAPAPMPTALLSSLLSDRAAYFSKSSLSSSFYPCSPSAGGSDRDMPFATFSQVSSFASDPAAGSDAAVGALGSGLKALTLQDGSAAAKDDEDEGDDDDGDEEGGPARLAMRDANHALFLDPYNTKAYGLRAELHGRNIKDAEGDEDGEGGDDQWEDCSDNDDEDEADEGAEVEGGEEVDAKVGAGGDNDDATSSSAALLAAKDSLAAFLLGGASDLALAAVAEEAIRRESKGRARVVFDRREAARRSGAAVDSNSSSSALASPSRPSSASSASSITSRIPKQWQVRAYLGGFDLPALALEMDALDGGDVEGEGGAVLREMVGLLETANCEGLGEEGPDEGETETEKVEDDDEDEDDEEEEQAQHSPEEAHAWTEIASEGSEEPALPSPNAEFVLHGSFSVSASPSPSTGSAATLARSANDASFIGTAGQAASTTDVGVASVAIAALLKVFQRLSVQALSGVIISDDASKVDVHKGPHNNAGGNEEDEEGLDGLVDDDSTRGRMGTAPAPLRARLLSIASSLCYLLGHTSPALLCLHLSVRLSPSRDACSKLGALLNDMDEVKGAHGAFGKAFSCGEASARSGSSKRGPSSSQQRGRGGVFLLLHMAELAANQSDFQEAVSLLEQARRMNETCRRAEERDRNREKESEEQREREREQQDSEGPAASGDDMSDEVEKAAKAAKVKAQRQADKHYESLEFTITTLLGVTVFRLDPNSPESALSILQPAARNIKAPTLKQVNAQSQGQGHSQEGQVEAASSAKPSKSARHAGCQGCLYLLLCLGEVLAQCGDLHGSLAQFRRAHAIDPTHPLPFVNAARSYLQLNQKSLSYEHLRRAIALDPSFPQPLVDLAQSMLFQGKTAACETILIRALALARHVGDIKDVVVAQLMTRLTRELQGEGLYVVLEEDDDDEDALAVM